MILIYGRRSEFEENPSLSLHRGSLLNTPGEELMSFDRLKADTTMRDAITVRVVRHGMYRAKWVPPVFTTGPVLAERLLHIDGIVEAINRNPKISEDRKAFLKRRIPYWKKWAMAPGGKGYKIGDRE